MTHDDVGSGAAPPRLRRIDRTQMLLRSVVVEELIAEDHPARAIWAFVGRLDLARYLAQVKAVEGGLRRLSGEAAVLSAHHARTID